MELFFDLLIYQIRIAQVAFFERNPLEFGCILDSDDERHWIGDECADLHEVDIQGLKHHLLGRWRQIQREIIGPVGKPLGTSGMAQE